MVKLKPYSIQASQQDELQITLLPRVNYDILSKTLRYPLLWVHEPMLQAWLPREVDFNFIDRLRSYTHDDERFERRLSSLGLVDEPLPTWEELAASMKRDGYVVVRNFFPQGACTLMADYFFRQPETHDRWRDMPGIKRTSVNNSPLMRLAHQSTELLTRYLLGPIKTSYSFTSAYEGGTTLPRHVDRPQCMYNASVMLAIDPSTADSKSWPLMISIDGTVHSAELGIGDAVYYSGVRDPHWREVLPANVQGVLGTFFHYVSEDFAGTLD